MKKILTTFILISSISFLFAQFPGGRGGAPKITGKITGIVQDSSSNSSLEFATIVLTRAGRDKTVNGGVSDANGKFKLTEISLGKYELKVTFLGYETKIVKGIALTPEKPDVDLGTVKLVSKVLEMDAVDIVSEKSLIENKIDKIVYNAELDVTTAGGDATEVLRKVPLLNVDIQGNVSLRGSQNLQILINGKPSGMFSNNVADALKMIPADEIKSVEVITTPGAKYDAEGTGGIINIITKKKKVEGVSGNVSAAIGNRQNNGSLNLNINKGRLGFNMGGSVNHSWPIDGPSTYLREDFIDGQTRTLSQNGNTESTRTGFGGRAGLFYDFNAYNSINSNFRIRGFTFDRDGFQDALFVDPIFNINQSYRQNQLTGSLFSGYDWNTDYTKKFKENKDREFTIGFQMSGNDNDQDISLERLSDDIELFLKEKSINDGNNVEFTFQSDYVHPFKEKKGKLEVGVKSIIRDIDSKYDYDVFDVDQNAFFPDPSRNNLFDYKQNVYSAYSSLNLNFGKKTSLIAGARYERTDIEGSFQQNELPFANNYDNLLPSVILSYKVKGFNTLKVSFNQRIQRPSLFYINPFTNRSDTRNIVRGNPELDPELSDQYEVSYFSIMKGVTISAAVYYKETKDVIESILSVDNTGVSTTTYQNIGKSRSIGTNIFGSVTIKKIWTLRGGFNLRTYNASGIINGVRLENEAIQYFANLNSTLTLKKGFKVEMFGFWNSPRATLQGVNPSFSIYSFGVKKDILDKKASIGLNAVQPFKKYLSFRSELSDPTFNQVSNYDYPLQSFGISFSYRFGKLDFSQQQGRRNKVRNDDQKQGEGNNNF